MTLEGIVSALTRAHTVDRALEYVDRSADFSVPDGLRAPVLAALLGASGSPRATLAVTATSREAEALRRGLACYAPSAQVIEFPAWETLPHERLSPSAETVGRRLQALRAVRMWRADPSVPFVLVASVRAALQPLVPGLDEIVPVELAAGSRGNDLAGLAERLVALAYGRVDMVTRRGEFAVRGGILDVFAPADEHPVRLEFFGDELEQIKPFSVADQRSLPTELPRIELPPSRELLLTDAVRQRAREMQHEFPSLATMLAKLGEGIPVEGMESLAPALVDRLVPLTHYLPDGAAIAVLEPERVSTRAANLVETNREFLAAAWNAATAGAEAPIDLHSGEFVTLASLRESAGARPWWTFSPFDSGAAEPVAAEPVAADGGESTAHTAPADEADYVRIDGSAVPSFAGHAEGAVDHVAALLRDGWRVAITAEGHGLVERAADLLAEHEASARIVDAVPADAEPGVAYLTVGGLDRGFEMPDERIAVLAEAEFFGRAAGYGSRQVKKLASRRRNVVDPLQLKAGDFVVHQTHGIGRFLELVQREVSTGGRNAVKTQREFLVIEYAPNKRGYPGDKLFVPTDQLDLLTRYVGGEAPSLSKMGGSDWAAAKGKARKAVRDIAVELVKLYSARMASAGHAFGPDTPWQRELEEAFPFAETPDQLQTIDEVKADMERPIPMDRLLSGDVGYGKTEVAVRAAFKAVQDGKQVAMIVPTTLLVRQHMETFAERFAGFPVHVRALSRFQTEKEAKETIAGLADGTVDVVIGTHRLLTPGIVFKDLGLVIIDEEQRFGVEHKDALKKAPRSPGTATPRSSPSCAWTWRTAAAAWSCCCPTPPSSRCASCSSRCSWARSSAATRSGKATSSASSG